MSDELWFMSNNLEKEMGEIDLMPEGGDFSPTGFYGLLQIHHLWRLYTETEPDVLKAEGIAPDISRPMGPGYLYLFKELEEAKAAQAVSGTEVKPQKVFYPEMPISTVFSFRDEEAKDKWGSSINGEIRKNTLASGYRGESHLVFIPAFVWAFAKLRGWTVPAPDFSAIDVARDEFPATDKLQMDLIGNAARGKKGEYKDSQYWQYRVALWAALGEPNPEAIHPKGTQVMQKGELALSDLATVSDKLSLALTILNGNWKTPVWARTKHLCNPRVDAESKAEKRLTVHTVLDLYKSEAEARAVYAAELAEMGVSLEDTEAKPANDVPVAWAEMPDEWEKQVAAMKAEGKEPTVEDAKALDVSFLELRNALAG